MQHASPGPDGLTPEQILEMRALDDSDRPPRMPVNLRDLCDVALGHRFDFSERRAARIELAQLYGVLSQDANEAQLPAPRWFNIDGTRHSIGDATDCSCRDRCKKCGARLHVQGGYATLFEFCEVCDIGDSTSDIAKAGRP